MMMDDREIKNKAHKIIEDGIAAGESDQEIVQRLNEEELELITEDGTRRPYSEEDVARFRASKSSFEL